MNESTFAVPLLEVENKYMAHPKYDKHAQQNYDVKLNISHTS